MPPSSLRMFDSPFVLLFACLERLFYFSGNVMSVSSVQNISCKYVSFSTWLVLHIWLSCRPVIFTDLVLFWHILLLFLFFLFHAHLVWIMFVFHTYSPKCQPSDALCITQIMERHVWQDLQEIIQERINAASAFFLVTWCWYSSLLLSFASSARAWFALEISGFNFQ